MLLLLLLLRRCHWRRRERLCQLFGELDCCGGYRIINRSIDSALCAEHGGAPHPLHDAARLPPLRRTAGRRAILAQAVRAHARRAATPQRLHGHCRPARAQSCIFSRLRTRALDGLKRGL
jgi:hypothetical protein